jgi:hypothetical protein
MARNDPEKLAQALRANLRRRKGPKGLEGPEDGRAPKRAPDGGIADPPILPPESPPEKPLAEQG